MFVVVYFYVRYPNIYEIVKHVISPQFNSVYNYHKKITNLFIVKSS